MFSELNILARKLEGGNLRIRNEATKISSEVHKVGGGRDLKNELRNGALMSDSKTPWLTLMYLNWLD